MPPCTCVWRLASHRSGRWANAQSHNMQSCAYYPNPIHTNSLNVSASVQGKGYDSRIFIHARIIIDTPIISLTISSNWETDDWWPKPSTTTYRKLPATRALSPHYQSTTVPSHTIILMVFLFHVFASSTFVKDIYYVWMRCIPNSVEQKISFHVHRTLFADSQIS